MSAVTFLVDDNQWLDAGVRDVSGKSRSPQIGDFIEAQLHVEIPKSLAWGAVDPHASPSRKTVELGDALYYFSGEVLDSRTRPMHADKEKNQKVLWEILISADFPILGLGVFSKGDSPYEPAVKFIEGIGLLWGSISFHALQLSKTITGKITNIKELPSAPMSNGRLILRLLTLDTSSVGPLAMKLSRPESERN